MDINLTNANEVKKYVEQYARNQHTRIINRLHRVGLNFVTDARILNTYKDQTGQLRSSIGYIITYDGVVVNFDFNNTLAQVTKGEDRREQGKSLAIEYANSLVRNEKGYCLICVAGANYALYVEAKGYDVITGSSLEATETLRKWFR